MGRAVVGVRLVGEVQPVAGEWLAALVERCTFPQPEAGPVAMAVSGGPDSMALMVLARTAGLEGRAVHVDHGLRPGSAEEARVVAAVAARLGFGFDAVRVEVDPGPDLEARARRARYDALPEGVLTGHTMDDQAETVLLNLLRGAAADGLAGMRPAAAGRRGSVCRPLLGLRRTQTVGVCRRAGIHPVMDPSNDDPRFRRNRVRHEAIPLLNDIAGRDVVPVLARQAAVAAADADLLGRLAEGVDPTSAAALRDAPQSLARRAVRNWLRRDPAAPGDEVHPPSLAEVERVLDVAAGRCVACEVSGGRRVQRSSGRLRIVPASPGPGPAGQVSAGQVSSDQVSHSPGAREGQR